MTEIEVWTYRQESSPKIIHDYLETKKRREDHLKSTINEDKLLKSGSIRPIIEISDFVIGRMEHVCKTTNSEKKIQEQRLKKQKSDIKFLSMIMEEEEDDDKKKSNLEKILRIRSTDPSDETNSSKEGNKLYNSSLEHDKSGF